MNKLKNGLAGNMNNNIRVLIHYLSTYHSIQGPIVELGSRAEAGQIGLADLRPFFPNRVYIGYDAAPGPGVNRVEDIHKMPSLEDNFAGTILCLDTLEHCTQPLMTMRQIYRCVQESGLVVISSHMYAPAHPGSGYGDYWRFTPQGFRDVLLADFGAKMVLYQGEKSFPITVVGLATKWHQALPIIDLNQLNAMLPWPYPYRFEEF